MHRTTLFCAAALAAFVGTVAAPDGARAMHGARLDVPQDGSSVQAVANRRAPHRNVNRRNDAGNNTGDAQTDALNRQSLQRAQAGESSPTPGPDTTANLNNMSEQSATRGRNMGRQAPMPFR